MFSGTTSWSPRRSGRRAETRRSRARVTATGGAWLKSFYRSVKCAPGRAEVVNFGGRGWLFADGKFVRILLKNSTARKTARIFWNSVLTKPTLANLASRRTHLREEIPLSWPLLANHRVFHQNLGSADIHDPCGEGRLPDLREGFLELPAESGRFSPAELNHLDQTNQAHVDGSRRKSSDSCS